MQVDSNIDEIKQYQDGRYLSPPESVWRLLEFKVHGEYPPVTRLAVHLPGAQPVYFDEEASCEEIQGRMEEAGSTLMAFFKYNERHEDGRRYLYSEFPAHYVYDSKKREWRPRKRGTAIGRMYHCNPSQGPRFYLRLLLTVQRGPKSFEDLKTVRGELYPDFRSACVALGLLDDDQEWISTFQEARVFAGGRSLRSLFAVALLFGTVGDPLRLWTDFKENICDDLPHALARLDLPELGIDEPHYDYGLFLISRLLQEQGGSLNEFGLPPYQGPWAELDYHPSAGPPYTESEPDPETAAELCQKLNPEQRQCFDRIVGAVQDGFQPRHFFVQGAGGTGKTFLYRTVDAHLRAAGKSVVCVASSGIAATLLPHGHTAHSQFKIPLILDESSTCNIPGSTRLGRQLADIDLVIWDEVPMQHRFALEAVHRILCDLRKNDDDLFGGVPVVLGGDFAQTLPIVPHGNRARTLAASLRRSFIWRRLEVMTLRQNMRLQGPGLNADFAGWLSNLSYDQRMIGPIYLPPYIRRASTMAELYERVFPAAELAAIRDSSFFADRAILALRNDQLPPHNNKLMEQLPGEMETFYAVDKASIEDNQAANEVSREYLQTIQMPGLPPSILTLKVGAPVMLLRNLRPRDGLCNGTRLVITKLERHVIEAMILTGDYKGSRHLIPRIDLSTLDGELPWIVTRRQFPIRPCFAMTVNKSQGQSLETVGIDLQTSAFSHGQLYVALSRCTEANRLTVILPEGVETTPNIVWPEVLEGL
jgi:PIF1-like helicase/Helicase